MGRIVGLTIPKKVKTKPAGGAGEGKSRGKDKPPAGTGDPGPAGG